MLPSGKDESILLEGRFIGNSCASTRPIARTKSPSKRRILPGKGRHSEYRGMEDLDKVG